MIIFVFLFGAGTNSGAHNESSCSSGPDSPHTKELEHLDGTTTPARAQYLSATCVVFTHYTGDTASVVDEHFSRALNFSNKDSKGECQQWRAFILCCAQDLNEERKKKKMDKKDNKSICSLIVCRSHKFATIRGILTFLQLTRSNFFFLFHFLILSHLKCTRRNLSPSQHIVFVKYGGLSLGFCLFFIYFSLRFALHFIVKMRKMKQKLRASARWHCNIISQSKIYRGRC